MMCPKAEQIHGVLSNHMLADGIPLVFDTKKSHDNFFVDSIDSRAYLDMFSFFASGALGHNHPVFSRDEVREELLEAAIVKPSLSDVYTESMAEFVEEVASVTPKAMPYHFFVEGGALAVENALKAAFDWKTRKNIEAGIGEKGTQILHFRHAFHGRSGYTLALTNTQSIEKTQYFPKFRWPRVNSPAIEFPITEESMAQTIENEQKTLEEIKQCFLDNPDDIAAVLIEPIQGEGGDRHFRPEFFVALKELTLEEDVLLIFDEVQTGLGITGRWWCHEHFDVRPDLMVYGKKMQVGGFCSTNRINEIDSVFKVSSRINSTFGGNLCDMVRGKWIIRTMKEESLVENSHTQGELLMRDIVQWAEESGKVFRVRGRGLMIAFDLQDKETRDTFLKVSLEEEGLLLLSCGECSIRFRPHLVFNDSVRELLMNSLEKVIQKI